MAKFLGPGGTFSLGFDSTQYEFGIFYESDHVYVQALSVIPEPSAVLLIGLGFALMLFRSRGSFGTKH